MQLLFPESDSPREIPQIPGLQYFPDFLSSEEQTAIWKSVNASPWLTDLKRRVQHYGYKYDYKARLINYSQKIGELPQWSHFICDRIIENGWMKYPDQLIVNEYQPGQGISAHIDCEPCFEETILSVSLGSVCQMDFV